MKVLRNIFTANKHAEPLSEDGRNALPLPKLGGWSEPAPEIGTETEIVAQAATLAESGLYTDALRLLEPGLTSNPESASLLFARASVLFEWGRFIEAAETFRRAAARGTPDASLCIRMGWSALYSGDAIAAEAAMAQSIALAPTARAHFGLGVVQQTTRKLRDAEASFQRSLALDPDSLDTHIMAGGCQLDLNEHAKAERIFRRAVALDSGSAAAWTNLAVALDRLDRHDEALQAFVTSERLERETGEDVGAFVNLAVCLRHGGNIGEALHVLQKLEDLPNRNGHFNYALALLAAGRLAEAWPHHEFRWTYGPLLALRAGLAKPVWSGQDLQGKTILLRAEQGFGDTIQFIRYAPWLKRLGATVYLRVQTGLESLAKGFAGVDRVMADGEPTPDIDFYIHPMSLPGVFGTELETIPVEIPYVTVDPSLQASWAERLGGGDQLNVGLVWAGSPEHQRDRYRSMPLHGLATLFAVAGAQFYSLQRGSPTAEIGNFAHEHDLIDLSAELQTFADTAAAISNLDLVLCVDTAVAHVAGALGKPVWLMLPEPADWRWLESRTDSPWYPSLRIFRQTARGDWSGVVEDVKKALENLCSDSGRIREARPDSKAQAAPAAQMPVTVSRIGNVASGMSHVAEMRYGIVQYFPNDGSVGPSVAYYGEYLQSQLAMVMRFSSPGAVILEAGCGIGAHLLGLAHQVGPGGHVIAYEWRPRLRYVLAHNVSANRLSNVTLMRRALQGAMSAPLSSPADAETIDDLQLDRLQWLKLGADLDSMVVLSGAEQTIWRLRPKMFVAVDNDPQLRGLAGRVKEFGYRCWRMETPLYDQGNFNRWQDDVFHGQTALSLLAIPEEVEVDTFLDGCVELA